MEWDTYSEESHDLFEGIEMGEEYILASMRAMCEESLDPEAMVWYDEIEVRLRENRSELGQVNNGSQG